MAVGTASSELTDMALGKSWSSVTGNTTGGDAASGTTVLAEPRDIAAMVSVKVLLE